MAEGEEKETPSGADTGRAVRVGPTHKPRLTQKVLRGLDAMCAAIDAGDLLAGDLSVQSADVLAAMGWVSQMMDHRARGSKEK